MNDSLKEFLFEMLAPWLGATIVLAFFGWLLSTVLWHIPVEIWGRSSVPDWADAITVSVSVAMVGGGVWVHSTRENRRLETQLESVRNERQRLRDEEMEEKSKGDRLRELYQRAAETSLLILNEDGTDIDSTRPLRCSKCGANGYSRKTKTPEWRCGKCGHEWH